MLVYKVELLYCQWIKSFIIRLTIFFFNEDIYSNPSLHHNFWIINDNNNKNKKQKKKYKKKKKTNKKKKKKEKENKVELPQNPRHPIPAWASDSFDLINSHMLLFPGEDAFHSPRLSTSYSYALTSNSKLLF